MIKISKLFKVAEKTSVKPELQKVYIKDKKAYATNGYHMVIMPVEIEGKGFLSERNVKLAETTHKITKSLGDPEYKLESSSDIYPNIDLFMEKVEADKLETPTVIFSRQSLIDTLEALQKADNFDKVEMYFVAKDKPVVFKSKNGAGIEMPCSY